MLISLLSIVGKDFIDVSKPLETLRYKDGSTISQLSSKGFWEMDNSKKLSLIIFLLSSFQFDRAKIMDDEQYGQQTGMPIYEQNAVIFS